MRCFVVDPPNPAVTWADAAPHLNLGGDETDRTYVEGLIEAVTGHLDGPQGELGRAIGLQTIETRFDTFETVRDGLRLFGGEIGDVDSVIYLDRNRAEVTVDPADYEIIGDKLYPVDSAPWTGCLFGRETLRVRYEAGYEVLPPALRTAILLCTADYYRFRETVAMVTNAAKLNLALGVDRLLERHRIYW